MKSILKITTEKKKTAVQILDDDDEEMDYDSSKRKPRSQIAEKTVEEEKIEPKKSAEKYIEDFEDDDLDSDTESADNKEDAEKQEEEMMNMPQLNTVLGELNEVKCGRRIVVNPLKIGDMMNPKFTQLIQQDSCEEIRVHFVRSKSSNEDWAGFLIMNFASVHSAEQAAELFHEINPAVTVKAKDESRYANQNMEKFVKEERAVKRWSDTLLFIKNIAPGVSKEQLEELFPDADDIVLRTNKNKKKDEETFR